MLTICQHPTLWLKNESGRIYEKDNYVFIFTYSKCSILNLSISV